MFECLLSVKAEAKARASAALAANNTLLQTTSSEREEKCVRNDKNVKLQGNKTHHTEAVSPEEVIKNPSTFDCLSYALHLQRNINDIEDAYEQRQVVTKDGKQNLLTNTEIPRTKEQITSLLSYVVQSEDKNHIEEFLRSFNSSNSNSNNNSNNNNNDVLVSVEARSNVCEGHEHAALNRLDALYSSVPLLYAIGSRWNDESMCKLNETSHGNPQYERLFELELAQSMNTLLANHELNYLKPYEINELRENFPNTFGVLLSPTLSNDEEYWNQNNAYVMNEQQQEEQEIKEEEENESERKRTIEHQEKMYNKECHKNTSELSLFRIINPFVLLSSSANTSTNLSFNNKTERQVVDVDDGRDVSEGVKQPEQQQQIVKKRQEWERNEGNNNSTSISTNKDDSNCNDHCTGVKDLNTSTMSTNSNRGKNSFSFNVTSDKINVNNGQTVRARSPPPLFPRSEGNELGTNVNDRSNITKITEGVDNNNIDNNSSKNMMTSVSNVDKRERQTTLEDYSMQNKTEMSNSSNNNNNNNMKRLDRAHGSATDAMTSNKKSHFTSLARLQEEEKKSYFSFTTNARAMPVSTNKLSKYNSVNEDNAEINSGSDSQGSLTERSKDFVTAGAQLLADVKAGRAGALASALAKTHAPALGLRRPGFQPPFQNQYNNNNNGSDNNSNNITNSNDSNIPANKILSAVIGNNNSNNNVDHNNKCIKGKRQRVANGSNNNNNNNSGSVICDDEDDNNNGENDYPTSLLLPDGSVPSLLLPLDASLVRQVAYEILENVNDNNINTNSSSSSNKIGWDDIAGLQHAKRTIEEAIVWPLKRPDLFTGLRDPPRGLLLFGPPGTGKTMIARAIAHRANCTFINISSSSIMSKWIGDGEKLVRCVFAVAAVKQPSVVFVDEIDSLLSTRMEGETDAVRRVKTEFLVQLDGVATDRQDRVLLIGATNRPDDLDEAARRRLEKRLYIPLPDHSARCELITRLLYTLERDYKAANAQQHEQEQEQLEEEPNKSEVKHGTNAIDNLSSNTKSVIDRSTCDKEPTSNVKVHTLNVEDISLLATWTAGFSGADLKQLCREAAMGPLREMTMVQLDAISAHDLRPISLKDFRVALKRMKPSVSSAEVTRYVQWNALFGSFSQNYEDDEDDGDDNEDKDDNNDSHKEENNDQAIMIRREVNNDSRQILGESNASHVDKFQHHQQEHEEKEQGKK